MLRRLAPYWKIAWTGTVAGAALITVAAGLELLQPWPIKGLVDYVFGTHAPPKWLAEFWPAFGQNSAPGMIAGVCLAIVILAVSHRVLTLVSQFVLIRAGARVVSQLRCRACDHVHRLSLTYHDQNKVGDSIYRIAYDTTAALTLIAQVIAPVFSGVIVLIGISIVMVRMDAVLTLVALAVLPLFWVTIRRFGRHIERRSKRYHESESSLVSTLQESLSSIRAVQAFSREPHTSRLVEDDARRSLDANCRLVFTQLAFSACVGLAMALGTAAVVWIGAQRVVTGALTIGDILVFLAYLGMLYQPINALSQSSGAYHTAKSQLLRVFEVLETPPLILDRPDAGPLVPGGGRIEFNGVTFGYGEDTPALVDVDLVIEPGQCAAVVGRTGAGKTTVASLLLRFYDPWNGAVSIDGQDLRDVTLDSLREHIGVVLQDAILFSATIAENIAYARPGASQEAIREAARRAQADDFITALPNGYDTMLGERGVNLSGGQRQRLAIVRAFLKNSAILVMDEPTSALDAQTESALIDAVADLSKDRTTFIISHRLSTVRLADVIVVIDEGRVTDRGTHDELIERSSFYRQLYAAHGAWSRPQASLREATHGDSPS